jgi:hypothetical protein
MGVHSLGKNVFDEFKAVKQVDGLRSSTVMISGINEATACLQARGRPVC